MPFKTADLLPRRMAALDLNPAAVARNELRVFHDLRGPVRKVRVSCGLRFGFEARSRGSGVEGLLSKRGSAQRADRVLVVAGIYLIPPRQGSRPASLAQARRSIAASRCVTSGE